jgi:chromosomal replication initiation ATPase DnaA
MQGPFNINVKEELSNFLGGNFHQDIESPEQALQDYIKRQNKKWMQILIDCAENFLNSNLSDKEKEEFIESNAEIYFPSIGQTPIQWLTNVVEQLKDAVKTK